MSHQDLGLHRMRQDANEIFQAALTAADPEEAILRHVQVENDVLMVGGAQYKLSHYDRILVVGAGKAGVPMARAVENLLGDRITDGLVVVKEGYTAPLSKVKVHEASHPVPDERGIEGATKILEMMEEAGEQDLVICLISGGGSALFVAPSEGITLDDKQEVTRLLLACGATIHEINAVRKHLSKVKGGCLARVAYPATVVNLILSDVVGDNLDVIASGPMYPDSSTFETAIGVFKYYKIWDKVPQPVRERLQKGLDGEIEETPKPDDPFFKNCTWELVGTNLLALLASRDQAESLGYRTIVLSSGIEGETREVAKVHTAMAKEVLLSGHPIHAPACILSGGETTVTIKGEGKGGRNQEFVVASALELDGVERVVALSGGTDGTDGPTDAAGAVADGQTVSRAKALGLDSEKHLEQNDAYPYFQQLGDLIITGPTSTNVMDIRIFLVKTPG